MYANEQSGSGDTLYFIMELPGASLGSTPTILRFREIFSFFCAQSTDGVSITQRPLPSKSLTIHHSPFNPSLEARPI